MSKTQITLAVAIIVAVGNAITPFLSTQLAGLVSGILAAAAVYFHTSDVNQAVATAKAQTEAQLKPQQ